MAKCLRLINGAPSVTFICIRHTKPILCELVTAWNCGVQNNIIKRIINRRHAIETATQSPHGSPFGRNISLHWFALSSSSIHRHWQKQNQSYIFHLLTLLSALTKGERSVIDRPTRPLYCCEISEKCPLQLILWTHVF